MSCFDWIEVPCPKCGKIENAQSKGGPCLMESYTLSNCPCDVMTDVNRHAPFECECGAKFYVEFDIPEMPKPQNVRVVLENGGDD